MGRDLLHAALEELRQDVNDRIRQAGGVSPFPACIQMDIDAGLQERPRVSEEIPDLASFCSDLQQPIAWDPDTGKELYYALPDIRCFLGGLAMSRLTCCTASAARARRVSLSRSLGLWAREHAG